MAFGNGTPDLLSTLETVVSVKHPEVGVAISELLGSGIFVTTICLAGVIFIKRSEIKIWSAVRDIGFYFLALGMLTYIVISERMLRVWKPLMFLNIYGLYWGVIMAGKLWMTKKPKLEASLNKCGTTRSSSFAYTQIAPSNSHLRPYNQSNMAAVTPSLTLLEHLNPVDVKEFKKDGIVSRAAAILKAPCLIVVKLSVPQGAASWCKPLAVIHTFTAPIFFIAAFQRTLGCKNQIFLICLNGCVECVVWVECRLLQGCCYGNDKQIS